jgi:diadenosine tetraphosphatase ApaH/serine/threonine PP2A family protein phosphatase
MTVGQSARLHSPGAGCEASVKPVLETQSLATRSCPSKEKIWPSFAVALPYWLSGPKAVSNALQKAWLRSLPLNARLERKGIFFHLVHATPPNPRYGRLDPDADEWAVELEQINADVLLVGHSHGLI